MPDLGEDTPYRVIRLLGKGSIADVFLAEERSTGGKVVLKVLRMPLSQTELETFLQHVQALSRILHPYLLRILNYGSTAQKPFLVTEHAPQGSLRQRILPGTRLTPDLVLSYVKQVADALHHLHQQHMLHLNLKPENLLLGQSGAILLSDAGLLAALPGAHTQFSADLAGSASYLAPEQIQGTATEASDQYALGCMVYEWLSGTPPFSGSFAEVVKQQLLTQPPLLRTRVPELSPLLEQIVAIALAKNPADRFATIQAFARAFENACYDTTASPTAGTSASNSPPLAQQAASSGSAQSAQHIAADKEGTRLIQPAASSKVVEQGADDKGTAQSGQQPAVSQKPAVPAQQAVSGKISMLFTCPGCGRPTPHSAGTSCPACGYPLDPAQERAMLDTVLRDLQPLAYTGGAFLPIASLAQLSDVSMTALRRVANNGGAHVSVSWLIQHYQNRMQALRAQRTAPTALAPGASSLKSPGAPATQTAARQRNASASKQPQAASTPAAANFTQQQPSASAPTSHPGFIPAPPSERPLPLPRVPRPGPVTALRPLIESPAGLMVALGTFLLLIAILVLPFAFPGEPLSLLITFGAQVFFAFMTVATHRSARFREFAGIYAGFFALTVPLLALDAFQSDLTTDIPLLIGLAALYATITYGAFAVTQRFSPFSVLSLTALFVADITLMPAITGSQQWTAGSLLCLALLLLPALSRHEHAPHLPLERLFETSWDVLRRACATFSWLVAGATACLYIPLTISSILSSLSYSTQSSVDFVQE
ncbi:MAG TPA: protein kinase, partial [Ktedonobacteraceae bacterium]|nr:protein kinase [Ktedonobacteraceae bacterium]